VERLYVRPHPDDPKSVIIDLAALQDLVARSAVVVFDGAADNQGSVQRVGGSGRLCE
jgi:hypothetical protein